MRSISLINKSSVVNEAQLQAFFQDMIVGLSELGDAWGIFATIGDTTTGGYPVTLLDQPEQGIDPAGALGYHDIDTEYHPYARVFCQLAEENSIPWTLAASHEIFEMLVDPLTNRTTFISNQNGTGGWIVLAEIADPVEMQYSKGGQGSAISSFVFPGWYIPGFPGPFDQLGLLTAPLQLAKGGYAAADYVEYASGWQVFTGMKPQTRTWRVHYLPGRTLNEV